MVKLRSMQNVYILILLLVVAHIVWRVWPDDKDRWHVDPADRELARRFEVRLIGLEAPRFAADANTLLTTMQTIANNEPRTWWLDGDIDEGMLTYTHRTLLGFRDYTTLMAVDEVGGAKLSVYARPGWNVYDWGVTQKRVDRWLLQAEQTLAR